MTLHLFEVFGGLGNALIAAHLLQVVLLILPVLLLGIVAERGVVVRVDDIVLLLDLGLVLTPKVRILLDQFRQVAEL